MTLKGEYAAGTSYSVGDVVVYTDGNVYHLQNPCKAGTAPVDTHYWGRVSQELAEAIKMVMNGIDIADSNDIKLANNLTTSSSGKKALDAYQGKVLKGLVDGQAETIAGHTSAIGGLTAVVADSKTLVLASSTASSTKKFSITVDDSGELTATEIVEETPAEDTPSDET